MSSVFACPKKMTWPYTRLALAPPQSDFQGTLSMSHLATQLWAALPNAPGSIQHRSVQMSVRVTFTSRLERLQGSGNRHLGARRARCLGVGEFLQLH